MLQKPRIQNRLERLFQCAPELPEAILTILDAARSSHRLLLREEKSSTRSDQCDHALARQINTYAGRTQLKCRRTRIQRLQPFADVIAEHVDGDTSEVRRVTLEPRQGSF